MKKFYMFILLTCCIFVLWCGSQKLWENERYYIWELIIAWVWPEISFEPIVEEWTLVLKWNFEDHSDHVFFNEWMWEEYLNKNFDYLPWNTVKFKWVVEFLDWAAGNHYYNVKSINKLEIVEHPNTDKINKILDSYNYCESDSDCGYFMWECPLWCYIPLNIKYIDIASNIVANFVNHLDERCVYGCLALNKAVCNDYKCEMIDAPADADVHGCWPVDKDQESSCDGWYDLVCGNDWKTYRNDCFACKQPLVETFTFWQCENDSGITYCTAYQKSADVCTMIYAPVCGNDWKTYWNDCVACQSETVESYTQWECENSAFVVEWDSKYLHKAVDILKKEWAVSCNLFFTDHWRITHALFMADQNRFYSEMDDYTDNYRKNQVYTVVSNGKIYYWSTFPDSDNIIENFNTDIEGEIAGILMDSWKHSDFQMNCSGGIENENLFNIPQIK